jgi:hypothetical protein
MERFGIATDMGIGHWRNANLVHPAAVQPALRFFG